MKSREQSKQRRVPCSRECVNGDGVQGKKWEVDSVYCCKEKEMCRSMKLIKCISGRKLPCFFYPPDKTDCVLLCTCSSMELILSTSQSMRKRFSCRRSISSMMRLYSVGSTMFPTERAVTCQLLATADSMMAWRIVKPGGAEGEAGGGRREESSITQVVFLHFRAQQQIESCAENPKPRSCEGYTASQPWWAAPFMCKELLASFLLQTINKSMMLRWNVLSYNKIPL